MKRGDLVRIGGERPPCAHPPIHDFQGRYGVVMYPVAHSAMFFVAVGSFHLELYYRDELELITYENE